MAQQIEKAMQKNEKLKDCPLGSISAVAAKLEKVRCCSRSRCRCLSVSPCVTTYIISLRDASQQNLSRRLAASCVDWCCAFQDAYEGSASKPVYRSKIASAKMTAAQACSLEDLAGSDSGGLRATTPAPGVAACSGAEGPQGSRSAADKDTAPPPPIKGDEDVSAAGAAASEQKPTMAVQQPDAALPEAAPSCPDDLREGLRRTVESCAALVSAAQGEKGDSCAKAEALAALVDLQSYPVTTAMVQVVDPLLPLPLPAWTRLVLGSLLNQESTITVHPGLYLHMCCQ